MAEVRPGVVIEVGVWKGASLLRMHELAGAIGIDTSFLAVDTWLGSAEHWLSDEDRARLRLRGGYPDLYRQFVFNLLARNAGDVFSLPMTSTSGAQVLRVLGVTAELIYIDAGHGESEVRDDLASYYALLAPGGVLFGDDYHTTWPGVVRAVDEFADEHAGTLETQGAVWIFRSSASSR